MGVDAGVLVTNPVLCGFDSFGVAYPLALAIQKLGVPDLILTGYVSGDTGTKAVGPLLAEALRLPRRRVFFVDQLPLSAPGKIDQRLLRKRGAAATREEFQEADGAER